MRTGTKTHETGVSEAIGFILIFSIVIAGIGLVTLYGYPMLLNQQTSANERIMEKNMIVLQNDLKSLAYKTVPFKETSLKVDGGSLMVYNASSTVATFDIGQCGGGTSYVSAFKSGDLRYTSLSSSTDISLQNGAVMKRQYTGSGSVMLAQPRWFYDLATNTMVINLVEINSTDTLGLSGIGTVQMALGPTDYTEYTLAPGNPVCLKYTPDLTPGGQNYVTAWEVYFTNSMGMSLTAPDTYRLPIDSGKTGTLVIKKYQVIIKSV